MLILLKILISLVSSSSIYLTYYKNFISFLPGVRLVGAQRQKNSKHKKGHTFVPIFCAPFFAQGPAELTERLGKALFCYFQLEVSTMLAYLTITRIKIVLSRTIPILT